MKRYVRSASYTANFASNDEWAEWLSKQLKLDEDEADMLLHDLNNLRGDEWIATMRKNGIANADIEQFKKFLRGVTASTSYKGGTGDPDEWDTTAIRQSGEPKLSRKIYNWLQWDVDDHLFKIIHVNRMNSTAKVAEEWVDENSGLTQRKIAIWDIKRDNRSEFICPKDDISYRLHSLDADNSAAVREYEDSFEEYNDPESRFEKEYSDDRDDEPDEYDPWGDDWNDDDYTPSSTRGDYGPSNPWDAPGMSIHDFF